MNDPVIRVDYSGCGVGLVAEQGNTSISVCQAGGIGSDWRQGFEAAVEQCNVLLKKLDDTKSRDEWNHRPTEDALRFEVGYHKSAAAEVLDENKTLEERVKVLEDFVDLVKRWTTSGYLPPKGVGELNQRAIAALKGKDDGHHD